VALVLDGHRSAREVARELGINHETLHNWVTKARRDRAAGPAALSSDERLELVRLRRKVAELEVGEILQQAAVVNACGQSMSSRAELLEFIDASEDRLRGPPAVPGTGRLANGLLRAPRPRRWRLDE